MTTVQENAPLENNRDPDDVSPLASESGYDPNDSFG
jgi:hypothetical protein